MSVPQVLYRMCVCMCVCVCVREREFVRNDQSITGGPGRLSLSLSLSLRERENIFANKSPLTRSSNASVATANALSALMFISFSSLFRV